MAKIGHTPIWIGPQNAMAVLMAVRSLLSPTYSEMMMLRLDNERVVHLVFTLIFMA
jgi:hypothetical protein